MLDTPTSPPWEQTSQDLRGNKNVGYPDEVVIFRNLQLAKYFISHVFNFLRAEGIDNNQFTLLQNHRVCPLR
jgi:hypothetical protein